MNKDVYGILGDLTAEILLEIIAECMDDYLYVIDLQNNKMEISQSALDRFMISETHVRNVKQEIMSVVYEEDRTMFAKHMQAVMDGTSSKTNFFDSNFTKNCYNSFYFFNCKKFFFGKKIHISLTHAVLASEITSISNGKPQVLYFSSYFIYHNIPSFSKK